MIFKGLNGEFKIVTATQYITRIKDSTKKQNSLNVTQNLHVNWMTVIMEVSFFKFSIGYIIKKRIELTFFVN